MNKVISLLATVIILVSCTNQQAPSDTTQKNNHLSTIEISCERIKILQELKRNVGEQSWPDFSAKPLEGTICFLQGDTTFVFNPSLQIIEKLKDQQHLECNNIKIIVWKENYASGQFSMQTSIERSDSSQINYQLPVEFCSNVEKARSSNIGIDDTEEWTTLVIHEMFHHFQFNHEPFKQYYLNASKRETVKADIEELYSTDSLYRKVINQENNLLLKCLQTTQQDSVLFLLKEFIQIRNSRLQKYSVKHKSIERAENVWEKLEGSARYLEYNLMEVMKVMSKKPHTQYIDSLFKDYKQFENFNIEKEPWLYQTEKSEAYYYSTGFNILRVFDKLKINYKSDIFTKSEKTLVDYLVEYVKAK